MTQSKEVRWMPLGDFIVQRREKYQGGDIPIRGVSRDGFIPPKQNEADYSKYNIFYKDDFVFNPARMELNSIALNQFIPKGMCSSLYEIFYISKPNILPAYINLFVKRDEFARQCEYIGSGSAREYCRVSNISEICVPVPFKDGEPDVERQQEVVNIWQGLRRLKEENEAIAKPLLDLCDAKMDELKHSAPMVALGEYIEEVNERNTDNYYSVDYLRGVTSEGIFDKSKAKTDGIDFSKYKIVKPNQFGYNPSRINLGSIALNFNDCIVSPMYIVFKIKDGSEILPDFLNIWYRRSEFQRSTLFFASGSVRDSFSFKEMCRSKIPVPPITVQRAIVDIYHCARRAKAIAEEANQQLKSICPALMQHIIHSAK